MPPVAKNNNTIASGDSNLIVVYISNPKLIGFGIIHLYPSELQDIYIQCDN